MPPEFLPSIEYDLIIQLWSIPISWVLHLLNAQTLISIVVGRWNNNDSFFSFSFVFLECIFSLVILACSTNQLKMLQIYIQMKCASLFYMNKPFCSNVLECIFMHEWAPSNYSGTYTSEHFLKWTALNFNWAISAADSHPRFARTILFCGFGWPLFLKQLNFLHFLIKLDLFDQNGLRMRAKKKEEATFSSNQKDKKSTIKSKQNWPIFVSQFNTIQNVGTAIKWVNWWKWYSTQFWCSRDTKELTKIVCFFTLIWIMRWKNKRNGFIRAHNFLI